MLSTFIFPLRSLRLGGSIIFCCVISAALSRVPAAQCPFRRSGANFPHCRRFVSQRWLFPCFPPFLWRKILNSAAVPVFAAAHFGDNLADFDTNRSYNLIENL